jgi:hypothetical protein
MALLELAYAAVNERDLQALASLTELVPDFEWHGTPEDFEAFKPAIGKEAVLERWREMFADLETLVIDLQSVEEIDQCVLVRVHEQARGRASHAETDRVEWHVWSFTDAGLPCRLQEFATREEALAAADG